MTSEILLPALPKAGMPIGIDDVTRLEEQVAQQVVLVDDLDVLQEWQARAAALERYLRGKELHGPMLGAQRRVEARIGQLLGQVEQGHRTDLSTTSASLRKLPPDDRRRFRVLARGLEHGLADVEWRSSRDPLVKLIQERFPVPRHVPTVTTEEGAVKKPRAERVKEIAERAGRGERASQIATSLGLSEQVELGAMAVCESAQRDLKQARVAELLSDFDCTAMGRLVLSLRNGRYYIIDGQHRKHALAQWIGLGWEGLPVECIVYTDLTEEEEAELFLKLNHVLSVTRYDKFKVAITANREEETKIKAAVDACGLRISRNRSEVPGAVSAVKSLSKVYSLGGSKMLIRTLKLCTESFGDAGLEGVIIEGFGHLFHRYGDAIDSVSPIEALSNIRGGVSGLINQANTFRLQTGHSRPHCVAAAAVKFINAGRRTKKLPDWWQEQQKVATAV